MPSERVREVGYRQECMTNRRPVNREFAGHSTVAPFICQRLILQISSPWCIDSDMNSARIENSPGRTQLQGTTRLRYSKAVAKPGDD